ncbi:MAG TPA: transglutaminase domain-containing protein [Parafilimonas sp.]|nr:transglutaminase domain-containing protein [Parafilimonas sp.]
MRLPVTCTILIACCLKASAGNFAEKDSNIVITSSKEVYEFVWDKPSNSVQVKESLNITYRCNEFRSTLPVVEFYNDKMIIDAVDFSVDGKKPKDVKPVYSYYQVDDYFYSDAHICYFPLLLDKKGSIAEVDFQKTIQDPRYLTNIYFDEMYPVASKQVVFKVPKWMRIELKEMNFDGYSISTTKGYDSKTDEDIYTFTANNIEARNNEKSCPGPTYIYPHILVISKEANPAGATITFFKSTADQYAWYRSILKNLSSNATIIKGKADELTAGKTADMDKVKAIFYWVQNNIRYIAFEDGIAGFLPDKAEEVMRKKYGDCKGMANLTKELLKAEGFDARLCWLGTNHIAYDYSTPSLAVDNHMICALMYKGKTYFLDATENYLGLDDYAERIQGRQILIEDGDKYILTHVPLETYAQNLDSEKRVLAINGAELNGTVNENWKGEEKEYILYQLNYIKKDKSQDALKRYLADGNADYKITDLKTSDLDDIEGDLTATYSVTHSNIVTSFGKDFYVDLDFKKELNGSDFDTSKRKLDYLFPYKTHVERITELTVPAGYKISSVPPDLSVKNNNYEFNITYTQQSNKIIYHKSIILKSTQIAKINFKQWNDDIAKLTEAYNQQIVLTAP